MNQSESNRISWWARLKWAVKRTFQFCLLFVLIYLLIALVGLIPVNNDFQPTPEGIEILIVSNLVHTDIFVPVQTDVIDWKKDFPDDLFPDDIDRYSHIAFGWGDEGFFINTPNWSDLTLSTAVNALLLPSSTCMHVPYNYGDLHKPYGKSVSVSKEQYRKIVEHIRSSFHRDGSGNFIKIPASYSGNDAFFKANGSYHCFNTCNSWTGRVLKDGGVRVPWYSPLPKTVFLWLPE